MKLNNFKLNLNRKLALIAVALGFIGLFAGSPYKGHNVSLNTQELSMIVEKTTDHIKVQDLADWIMKGRTDYRLIDLRTENEYNEYHIPGSENVQITELENYGLKRNEKIVLYSEGGIHSAQGWMLLKAMDYKGVYMLFGGLEEWNSEVLFPSLSENATDEEKKSFEKNAEISRFFGGAPQTSSGTGVVKTELEKPKMEMPKIQSPPGGNKPPPKGKKKKEGC